jgi:hypothetical protein
MWSKWMRYFGGGNSSNCGISLGGSGEGYECKHLRLGEWRGPYKRTCLGCGENRPINDDGIALYSSMHRSELDAAHASMK